MVDGDGGARVFCAMFLQKNFIDYQQAANVRSFREKQKKWQM
jgi:hypothetical protein